MAAHRYYRLNLITGGSVNYPVFVASMELRAAVGGANLAVAGNGTASALSTDTTYVAANAFDVDDSTSWRSSGNLTTGNPQWLQWDFGAGNSVDVAQMTLRNAAGASTQYSCASGEVLTSEDGTTWSPFMTFFGRTTTAGAATTHIPDGHGIFTGIQPASTLAGFTGAAAGMVQPADIAVAYGGATAVIAASSSVAVGYSAARGDMSPAAGTLSAVGTAHDPNNFAGAMSFSALAYGGAVAELTGVRAGLALAGVSTVLGQAALTAAPGTLVASGMVAETGGAALTMPTPQVAAYSGAVLSVRVGGTSTLVATGSEDSIGGAAMRLPLCRLVATGSPANYGTANLTSPALVATGSGRAVLSSGFKLIAYGSAVVTPTYEAYAVNLLSALDRNPQNQYDPDVREVTHYTNYPFTQIVRYLDSYYGVAADGLYLLEGDTDAGAPIGWSFRTALTDAGSKQFKRVRSVYIGARLVEQTTVTLVVGEEQDLSYNYTTPRSSKAQNYRQLFGKGVRTRYFAVEMSDPLGSYIEIDSLDLENETLERAI